MENEGLWEETGKVGMMFISFKVELCVSHRHDGWCFLFLLVRLR
jgi:hypothetical protein